MIVLQLPGFPGICVEESCEAEATEFVGRDETARFRLCSRHADQWRQIDSILTRRIEPRPPR